MGAGVTVIEEPAWRADETENPLLDAALPYTQRLQLRPWETPPALQRLNVPRRLFAECCPVKTKWVAISGATCAGKTTTVRVLEEMGFLVLHEVARAYVMGEIGKGRTVAEVRAADHPFRHTVFRLTKEAEIAMLADAHKVIFLDRSALDSISFHRASGYDPHEIVRLMESYRYDRVFHCNPLPFVNDGLRTANEDRRLFLDAALERDYRALGYQPIRVPYGTVRERIEFILRRMG